MVSAILQGDLEGGCNCGSVRYVLREGFRLPSYACHCTDCQTRTGSAFSEHMLFTEADLHIEGPLSTGTMVQPSGAVLSIHGCGKCMARIYATNDRRAGFASLRCGTLDNSSHVSPAAHIWVASKQSWIVLPDGIPVVETQPSNEAEWLELLKPQ